MYAIIGLKVVCIDFHMFLGMVKETSKDKKWSKGYKESVEGQGKAIQVRFTWSGKISYNTYPTILYPICSHICTYIYLYPGNFSF